MEQKVLRNVRELRIGKPFLICGRSAQNTELYRHFTGLGAEVFQEFSPNPGFESARNAARAFIDSACDCIVGLGGGSAMDVAKCVKLWAGGEAPLAAIPTTAGTGSEATCFAVVYRNGEKTSVEDEKCLPDAVLLDPTLLETLPEYHRKCSMLDALCHGMESFWSVRATAESREYAVQAVRGMLSNMDAYLKNEPEGNAGMQQAAYLAGKAINISRTTAGHAMCYKLTTIYGIAHGQAAALCNGVLWPYMCRKGGAELQRLFDELAKAFGCDSVEGAVRRFQGIVSGLGLDVPVPSREDYEILKSSVNAQRLKNNPVPLHDDEINMLYHQILGGERT